ncbi:efflux RND transporter periplasmic adaptor subunit [Agrobacterium sp. rho-8.1]|nr:efflux RND transporter periplasmic adaptor subunit [Agrobacterium sp. rho-8.1]
MTKTFLLSSAGLIAVAGVAAAAFLFWPNHQAVATTDPRTLAPYVSVTEVKVPASASRGLTGTVAARVQSDLGFRVPGKIVERLVNVGEDVKAGQPLIRIDETDLRLARTAKRNGVIAAQATFVQALADEKRFSSLVKTNAASTQQYERAKAALDTAEAQLSAAKADENVADNEATYSVLYADVDGTVVDTLGEPGQVVAAGQTVVRLAKAGAREALVWMPENIRPQVGTVASASIYGRDGRHPAILRQISASADPQTRTYESRWVLQGAAADAPLGATVSVNIPNKEAQTHAEIPVGAIIDDGRRSGVWVVDKAASTVRFQDIKIERLGIETAIVSGLNPGEGIVSLGAHLLTDGATIRTTIEKAEVAQ